eukprot:6145866-Amphidinium_carterae.1
MQGVTVLCDHAVANISRCNFLVTHQYVACATGLLLNCLHVWLLGSSSAQIASPPVEVRKG